MTTHAQHQDRALPESPLHEPPPPEAGLRPAACSEADDPERLAYLASLKIQIREGVYRPDIRDLARSLANMLVQRL